jgi:hypothetical protein
MSLQMFRSQLRSAVHDVQVEDVAPRQDPPAGTRPSNAEVLRRVARGEISVDEALAILGETP